MSSFRIVVIAGARRAHSWEDSRWSRWAGAIPRFGTRCKAGSRNRPLGYTESSKEKTGDAVQSVSAEDKRDLRARDIERVTVLKGPAETGLHCS
jgi:hypothetical protein